MVRLKRRWLLVRIESKFDMLSNRSEATTFPTKNELNRFLRDALVEYFGVACSSDASETQGTSRSLEGRLMCHLYTHCI
jgi:hypothetical protein